MHKLLRAPRSRLPVVRCSRGTPVCATRGVPVCGGRGLHVCWPRPDYGPVDVRRSQLMNGIRVAAAKSLGANTAACTIMFQAGSRYEAGQFLGATHLLRAASQLSGCGYSSFMKTRYLAQHAASVTCSSDRETVAYTLRCPVPCFGDVKNIFLDTAVRCCFNEWEVRDIKDQVRTELAHMPPERRALDLVQQACWGGALGNSVYCAPGRVGALSEDHLNCFVRHNYRTYCCAVATVGVPFEETMAFAESIEFSRERPAERCETLSYPRAGFAEYDLGKDSDTWIAVAVPSCGMYDLTSLVKHAIVAAACGTGDVAAGQHALDRAPQLPLGLAAGGDVFTRYTAFNVSYKDTGLFGILAKTRAETAHTAAMAAAEFLCNVGELDFKQIEIGKRRLKLHLAACDEDSVQIAEGLALQLAADVQVDSAKDSMSLVDSMCLDSISCTAKSLSSKRSQMAVAVVGDIGRVPHDCNMTCGVL